MYAMCTCFQGNKFAMYVIVPNAIMGIPRILSSFSDLRDELNSLNEYIVDIALPRFKFEYTSHLERILREVRIFNTNRKSAPIK